MYELNSTVTVMNTQPQGANVVAEIGNLINNTGHATLVPSDLRTNTMNFIQANISELPVILSAMIIAQVDPMTVASAAQDLGHREITEQMVADHTSANIATYLSDADGKLAAM